jgi:hypothetical protein
VLAAAVCGCLSSDTNDYLRDALGPDFSAKDFRASTATVFAAVGLAVEEDSEGSVSAGRQSSARPARRPSARQHPCGRARVRRRPPGVIERDEDGHTVGRALRCVDVEALAEEVLSADGDEAAVDSMPADVLAEVEAAVVDLIEGSRRRRAGGPSRR